jgi:long-subunit fatty acid transport protein
VYYPPVLPGDEPTRACRWLAIACVLAGALMPAAASANSEPTAYDTRSVSMGLTGTTFLERASALVLNPANMEGIEKLGFTFNFTGIFTSQVAPVQGPNTSGSSGLGFGPLPSGFIGGRIAPRVVFTSGIYIETGYGSSFDDVVCLDGDVVVDGVPDTDPSTCTNNGPQSLDVTFFVGEFSAGTSIRVTDEFWIGVALRLPFSKQIADLWQNVGAALGFSKYARVKNNLGGVGFPSPRIGLTYKPHRKVSIGAMYRMWSTIKLTGTTETSLFTSPDGSPLTLDSTADWHVPHALQFGVAYLATTRLLLAWELRIQFHGADKHGNQNQTVVAADPNGALTFPIIVPFGWVNAYSAKFGVEYRFKNDLLAFRGGFNLGNSATSAPWAQYFTPPPGIAASLTAGLGFYWNDRNDPSIKDKYMLDIGTLFAYSGSRIGDEYIGADAQIPGGSPTDIATLCSADQVVRTGCPGEYAVFTYWASLAFTLQY